MPMRSVFAAIILSLKAGNRSWLSLYVLSIIAPLMYIALFNFRLAGPDFSLLFDLSLAIISLYSLLVPFFAIAQLFWTTINSHTLTKDKLLRLLLTYFYMLFVFAGLYLVIYFRSDCNLVLEELPNASKAVMAVKPSGGLAFSGISHRFWAPVASLGATDSIDTLKFLWRNLPFIYLDMVYFSTTTLTTLGFGDIVAKEPVAKTVVIIEALLGNLLLVLGVSSIVPRKENGD